LIADEAAMTTIRSVVRVVVVVRCRRREKKRYGFARHEEIVAMIRVVAVVVDDNALKNNMESFPRVVARRVHPKQQRRWAGTNRL
jgi:hypothetical protein